MLVNVEMSLRLRASRKIAPIDSAPNKPAIASSIGNCCSIGRLPISGNLNSPPFFVSLPTVAAATSAFIFRVWAPVVPPVPVVVPPAAGNSMRAMPGEITSVFFFLRPNKLEIRDPEGLPPGATAPGDVPVFFLSLFIRDGNLNAMGFSVTCLK